MLICAGLMLVFVFFAWLKLTLTSGSVTYEGAKMGIATWYGFFAFLCAAVAVAGCVYNHTTLTFCAAVLGVLFALIGLMSFPEMTLSTTIGGHTDTEVIKDANHWEDCVKMFKTATKSYIGAGLYLFASIGTAVLAFLNIKK